MAVHQQRLDRCTTPAGDGEQPVTGEFVTKRLDTEPGEQRRQRRRVRLPEHDTEAARVGKPEDGVGEDDVDVIVAAGRRSGRHEAQAARHAEVDDQGTVLAATATVQQQILATPAHGGDTLAGQRVNKPGRQRQAQAGGADDSAANDLSLDFGQQPTPTYLDFGQLRHCLFLQAIPNNIANFSNSMRSNAQYPRKQQMPNKLIVAALALAFAWPVHAAGEKAAKGPGRKPAATRTTGPASSEDIVARTVFQALVGDLALQRGDSQLGISAWNDLARRTRDPKVIARATEVAANARQYDLALELVRFWLEVEPDSAQARQMESSLLIVTNRIDDLAPQFARLLEQDKANAAGNLMHLNRMLARHADKKAVQRLVDRVAAPYANLPEAHFAMGQAAAAADDSIRAVSEFQEALIYRPDWEVAALARAQVQARQSTASAIDDLARFVVRNPDARDARLALARLLIVERRYEEARIQFDRLLKDSTDNPEVVYPLAVLALQQGDKAVARAQLDKLLAVEFADKNTIHYFLGQLDEEEKKPEAALEHYRRVTGGDQYIPARARAAHILLTLGRDEEAREMLRATRTGNAAERVQLILAEAQVLREAGRGEESYVLLETALAGDPDNLELLYETALAGERQGKPEVTERHLRRLLALKPEHAHGLNALGYSLADRNVRLDEAYDLISRATALAPDDPFIMDSMGWVLFRQGRLPEALATLERAYALRPDPEIAVHLGEVLWTMGRKEDAERFLKEAARKFPDSQVVATALKKFRP